MANLLGARAVVWKPLDSKLLSAQEYDQSLTRIVCLAEVNRVLVRMEQDWKSKALLWPRAVLG